MIDSECGLIFRMHCEWSVCHQDTHTTLVMPYITRNFYRCYLFHKIRNRYVFVSDGEYELCIESDGAVYLYVNIGLHFI
uniref:Uncharacterized protein n=1 Tax=Arundo donax TaxID=35708 RepID=A0A0A9BYT5_ARUDO